MVTVELADTDHVESICRVCAESWRDAYDDVLPAEYVEANVRIRYESERTAGQIAERDDTDGSDDGDDSNDPDDNDDTEDNNDSDDTENNDDTEDNDDTTDAVGVGRWLGALDGDGASAEASDSVVGTVRDDRPEPGVGEVSNLYVRPDRQGEGVGSLLLETLTERHHEDGATEQHVYVFADNRAAIGFYESKGFAPDERFAAATVDGVDPDREAVKLVRSL